MKKIISILLCLFALLSLASCKNVLDAETEKREYGEFSIEVPDVFEEVEVEGYTAYFKKDNVYVWAIKDDFINLDGSSEWDVSNYADRIYEVNDLKFPTPVTVTDGLYNIEYTVFNEMKNMSFTYLTVMYKGSDAFWMVQFACEESEYKEYKPHFFEWAKTVKVT
ncbi:MAG: hypothetical protein IJX27_02160 [Clostridia bacterium]|nr:hypothetical protein [Clostridia bacterium]